MSNLDLKHMYWVPTFLWDIDSVQNALQHHNLNNELCYKRCWWLSDSARVSHRCDSGLIQAPCGYLVKVTLVTCEKSVVQFDSTKHRRFSLGTPVSSCCNTGPMRGGPLGRTVS